MSAVTAILVAHSLQVNDFQVRLRSVTRRMMATVSELSMWQATGIKLGAQQQELEVLLAEAMQRLEVGLQGIQHLYSICWLHADDVGMPPTLCRAAKAARPLQLHRRTAHRISALQALQQPASLCTVCGSQQCEVPCRGCRGSPIEYWCYFTV